MHDRAAVPRPGALARCPLLDQHPPDTEQLGRLGQGVLGDRLADDAPSAASPPTTRSPPPDGRRRPADLGRTAVPGRGPRAGAPSRSADRPRTAGPAPGRRRRPPPPGRRPPRATRPGSRPASRILRDPRPATAAGRPGAAPRPEHDRPCPRGQPTCDDRDGVADSDRQRQRERRHPLLGVPRQPTARHVGDQPLHRRPTGGGGQEPRRCQQVSAGATRPAMVARSAVRRLRRAATSPARATAVSSRPTPDTTHEARSGACTEVFHTAPRDASEGPRPHGVSARAANAAAPSGSGVRPLPLSSPGSSHGRLRTSASPR